MHRKLFNDGAAVHGWINVENKRVNIFAYSKGYIGKLVNGIVYDEKNQIIGELKNMSLEQYIIDRNGGADKDFIRRKMRHETKIISFEGGN